MKLLTIAIPTYNMENYLSRCLDSLIVDDALMETLEVLVVNDGSKDSSSQIGHSYEAKYPHTFRVIDKGNGNYGSCVNRALKEAQGEYFKILDADDWFDTEGFTTLLRELASFKAEKPDVIFTKRYSYNDGHDEPIGTMDTHLGVDELNTIIDANTFDFMQRKNVMLSTHCITARTQLLRDNGYMQQEGISYTDAEFAYYAVKWAKTYYFMDILVYKYLKGRPGQTMDIDAMLRGLPSFYKVCRRLLLDYGTMKAGNVSQAVKSNMAGTMIYSVRYFLIISLLWKKQLTSDEKSHLKEILELSKSLCYNASNQQIMYYFHNFPFVKFYRATGIRPYYVYNILKKIKQ